MSGAIEGSRSSFQPGGSVKGRFFPDGTEIKHSPVTSPLVQDLSAATIHLPSGDQDRERTREFNWSYPVISAILRSGPWVWDGVNTRSAISGVIKRKNATVLPSGDQAGLRSGLGSVVARESTPGPICLT